MVDCEEIWWVRQRQSSVVESIVAVDSRACPASRQEEPARARSADPRAAAPRNHQRAGGERAAHVQRSQAPAAHDGRQPQRPRAQARGSAVHRLRQDVRGPHAADGVPPDRRRPPRAREISRPHGVDHQSREGLTLLSEFRVQSSEFRIPYPPTCPTRPTCPDPPDLPYRTCPTCPTRPTCPTCPTGNRPRVSINRVNDADLVQRARQGDPAAFGELVNRHRSAVYRAAVAALGSHTDAEDAAQDAFLAAYQAARQLSRGFELQDMAADDHVASGDQSSACHLARLAPDRAAERRPGHRVAGRTARGRRADTGRGRRQPVSSGTRSGGDPNACRRSCATRSCWRSRANTHTKKSAPCSTRRRARSSGAYRKRGGRSGNTASTWT